MKVLVVADGHYYGGKDGKVYVESVFDYNFYARYLSVFEDVYAIVRLDFVEDIPSGCKLASGEHVHFLPIPSSRGVIQYFKNYFATRNLVRVYVKDFDCAIFRIPGVVANLVCSLYAKTGKKFAIEVVVDPWEYFAKGTIKGFVRPIVRYLWTIFLKKMCMKANGVSYVTKYYLQKKYPCRAMYGDIGSFFTSFYSSVDLPDDKFGCPRNYETKSEWIISHAANTFSGYGKGHITLMNALKVVIDRGYNVKVWFIGDGLMKEEFMSYAVKIGIKENVEFLGRMPSGAEVREKIGKTDLFVFPTKAEGLPRVVLEAMAEGLPVITSPVCGIPELIEREYLVDYDDYLKYADAIVHMINNPHDMTGASIRNIEVAKEYRSSVLKERRDSFYKELKDIL